MDAATRMFWRNVRARTTTSAVTTLGVSPGIYDLPPEAPNEPLAAHLPEGLARRKRPREATIDAQPVKPEPDRGEANATLKKVKSEATPASIAGINSANAVSASKLALPGADLPPVIAPPGRQRGPTRGRGGISRPASTHVDDYERGTGARPIIGALVESSSVGALQSAPSTSTASQSGTPHAPPDGMPGLHMALSRAGSKPSLRSDASASSTRPIGQTPSIKQEGPALPAIGAGPPRLQAAEQPATPRGGSSSSAKSSTLTAGGAAQHITELQQNPAALAVRLAP